MSKRPRESVVGDKAPIQESKLTPMQESKLTPMQESKLTPMQESKLTPIQESKSAPIAPEVFQCCHKKHARPYDSETDPHRRGSAWSITNMPAEIARYAIDEPVNYDLKALDIQRHKDDATRDPFQLALLCLRSTEINQKIFAFQSLPHLINHDENRTFKEITPEIEAELINNSDPELHTEAARSFGKVIRDLLGRSVQRAKQLLNCGAVLATSAEEEISSAWYNCFDYLVDVLSSADLQREILPQVLERFAKGEGSTNGKTIAGKLMSKLTKRVPEGVVSRNIFPIVESLCQDPEASVRGTMVGCLPEVIAKLKDKNRIFPLLNSLLEDTDASLLSDLVGALGRTVTLMNPKEPKANTFFQTTLPIFKKLVKRAYIDGNSRLLIEFSAFMGQISNIFSNARILSYGDKLWFLDAFLQLSRYGVVNSLRGHGRKRHVETVPPGFIDFSSLMEFRRKSSLIEALINNESPDNNNNEKSGLDGRFSRDQECGWMCRANAAAGFFHFLKFAKPLVDFRNGLHPLIADLIRDPVAAVRAKMAENIYPIMKHIGTEGAIMHSETVYALTDDTLTVVEAIISNLANIFKLLTNAKIISPDNVTDETVDIACALQFCEERLSQTNNWRIHATILEQLSVLPMCFPGDHVYNFFVPALFHRLLHMRQLPCRFSAAEAIISFLRHCRRSNQREDIQKRIKEGFAQGRSVHDRMLFLFMSKKIMDIFSRKYYRENFFETTLAMTDDNVPNIRLKAVNMMPNLKAVLQMSEDPTLLKKLEETLIKIKNSENDRDVQNAIESVIPAMAKIGVVFKGDKKGTKTKEDLEDEEKEREEAFIASLNPDAINNNSGEKRRSLTNKRHSIDAATKPIAPTPRPVTSAIPPASHAPTPPPSRAPPPPPIPKPAALHAPHPNDPSASLLFIKFGFTDYTKLISLQMKGQGLRGNNGSRPSKAPKGSIPKSQTGGNQQISSSKNPNSKK